MHACVCASVRVDVCAGERKSSFVPSSAVVAMPSLPSFLSVGKESRFFIQFVAVVIVVVVASKETFEIFSRQISSFLRSVASDKRRDVKNDDNDFHILFQNLLLKG